MVFQLSMSAIIMIPTITIVALVTLYLIGTIIFYIKQKPVANQSSFDIVALHLAWTTLHIGRSDPKIKQTKMLVTGQRFGDLFLFGLVRQYSSVQTKYHKGRFIVMATYLQH